MMPRPFVTKVCIQDEECTVSVFEKWKTCMSMRPHDLSTDTGVPWGYNYLFPS